jgi:peptidoglycan/xylan/chitin deacetylase (PgdA/CDA1 family)
MPLALLTLLILAAAAPTADAIVPLTEAPDESGGIPILMYHHVCAALDTVYNVPPAVFENQLLQLYEAGFVLISLSDYFGDAFRVPAGRKPLVLTFDDGFPDNFRLLPDGSIDPDCAVGVLEAFAREHPDFGHTAVFFLNAGVWVVPFGDAATAGDKLRWLVENGYEIGNHTTDHVNLRRCDSFQVRRQIGLCQAALYDLCPELEGRVRFFAYPTAGRPRTPRASRPSRPADSTGWTTGWTSPS